jgi:hypothetical protein
MTAGNEHCGIGWVQLDCPFCGDHQQWHLGFNLEWGYFNCWKCGRKDLWKVIGILLRTNDQSIIAAAVAKHKTKGSHTHEEPRERNKELPPPPGCGAMVSQHRRYLRARGFDPTALAREWGLQGTQHLSGIWNWRVIIPVHNETGGIVAYQGRSILTKAEPKYRFTPNNEMLEDPKGLLYGLHKAGDDAIVLEGVTGSWRLGPGAIATFGIDWKKEQANKLRRFKRRFILFDPEPVAQKRALELATWLGAFPGETEVLSGFDKQPGEFTPEEADSIRRELGFRS